MVQRLCSAAPVGPEPPARRFGRWGLCLGLLPLGLAGCNRYAMFAVAGYQQVAYSNRADIIFVADNSASMQAEAEALAQNFNVFITKLTSPQGAEPTTDNLSDAVDNYITYTQERGRFVDYQIGITTTSVDPSQGASPDVDPGEQGTLLGDPKVIKKSDAHVADEFRKNLLCYATNFNPNEVPTDPSYQCGDDPGDQITQQYLDCLCGFDQWKNHSGSGTEEHLEAALLAMCAAVEDPPSVCDFYQDPSVADSGATLGDDYIPGANAGLIREGSTIVVLVVTDEGDTSRRLFQGDEDPAPYLDAYQAFVDHPIKFAIVGPPMDPDTLEFACHPTDSTQATTWGTLRLQTVAEATGGFYDPIAEADADGNCVTTDFATHLERLGDLLNNLLKTFELQSIPEVSSIRVYIDGEMVPEAKLVSGEYGSPSAQYDDGWSYDPSENAVVFWGSWIPDYNSSVRIYYLPLEGKPREVPF